METKLIKCPKCGVTLQVKNSSGAKTKTISCPRCNATLQISFAAAPARPAPAADMETVIPSMSAYRSTFSLQSGGRRYRLQTGFNSVGRRCSQGGATVMIDCDDIYMSRQHAIISVVSLPNGGMKATIKNGRNKNRTLVNGQPIADGDEIVLSSGDELLMGKTTLRVVQE